MGALFKRDLPSRSSLDKPVAVRNRSHGLRTCIGQVLLGTLAGFPAYLRLPPSSFIL